MIKLTTDVNAACNIDCEFCYEKLDGSIQKLDDILSDVRAGLKVGSFELVEIGGGEPLLYKDLPRLVSEIVGMDKKVNISTNGTILRRDMMDLSPDVRERTELQVSLHASNPELYRDIVKKDFFNTVIKNITEYKQNYSLMLSMAVYEKNFKDVSNMIELARDLDLKIRVTPVFPEGKGKEVQLLDREHLEELRGILLVAKIADRDRVYSPLLSENNCYAMTLAYGLEKKGDCPVDVVSKVFIDPQRNKFKCEFYRG